MAKQSKKEQHRSCRCYLGVKSSCKKIENKGKKGYNKKYKQDLHTQSVVKKRK